MAPIYKVSNPGQIVETLPSRFGFMPSESVVVITASGERNRLGFAMRLDYTPSDVERSAHLIEHHVTQNTEPGDRVIVLVLTEADPATITGHVEQIIDAMSRDVLVAGIAHDGDLTEWPTGDTWTYTDPAVSVATTTAVAAGMDVAPSREVLTERLAPQYTRQRVQPGRVDPTTAVYLSETRGSLTDAARDTLIRTVTDPQSRDRFLAAASQGDTRQHSATWCAVATQAHRQDAGAAYTIAATMTYLTGDGARAMILAEYAARQRTNPLASLLEIVQLSTAQGLAPNVLKTLLADLD